MKGILCLLHFVSGYKRGKTYYIAWRCRATFVLTSLFVNRVQGFIRNAPGHSIHRKSYPDGTTTQQAERNYLRIQERYGATRANQLSSHCDRHWEAQRLYMECLNSGMTKKRSGAGSSRPIGSQRPEEDRLLHSPLILCAKRCYTSFRGFIFVIARYEAISWFI